MQTSQFIKAGLLAIAVAIITAASWEIYLRHVGVDKSYDDNRALWAYTRGKVYEPKDQSTVFIGSSRIKFDLDIPTWQQLTGDHAVQLACVGSSPAPVLRDLANDPNFKGNLIIDITEGVFFKRDVDKILARGGRVIFICPPSTGFFWDIEQKGFPRAAYWERLLTLAGCKGIYFKDYPATADLDCPEWSHLSPEGAVIYTKSLIKTIQDEMDWSFINKPV